MSASLLTRRDGRLLILTLNRPEKRNALNLELSTALLGALEDADSDPGVGAILIQAAGPVFCAGMDLSEALAAESTGQAEIHERLFTIGTRIGKPIVTAVQGAALAGGIGLLTNAHVVVASEEATFGLTEIRVGLWPFLVFRSVAMALGERRALELSLTARIFSVREALDWGLVHHVAPSADLAATAAKVASNLAASSAEAVRLGLHFVSQARGTSDEDALRLARSFRELAFASADCREGLAAFSEKRPPRWPSLG